jgi:hypothetical protein
MKTERWLKEGRVTAGTGAMGGTVRQVLFYVIHL